MSDVADYEAAGFRGRLEPGSRPALIIIDPCEAYTNPESPLYAGVEDAVERMRQARAAAADAGVPVFITRVKHEDQGRDGGIFTRKVPALKLFREDSPFSGYIDGLAPGAGDIEIVKQYPSAFAGTSLAATLASLRIDTLIITGLSTSGCVRATATDSMQSGFIAVVVREAVGDRLPGPHEANLFDIQAKIGEVVSLDESVAIMKGAA